MEILSQAVEIFLHIDKHMGEIIQAYGVLTYVLLFVVVFCETGLVVTPFLPGDSLLFAAGTFAAIGQLNPFLLAGLLMVAAIGGDTVNYWIGAWMGPKVFTKENTRLLNKKHLIQAQHFYEKHGAITIIIARFIPIIRTFAPFVAGIGTMRYSKFILYNVVGGIAWVNLFVWVGYFVGNLEFVKSHFSFIALAIIIISVIPAVVEFFRTRAHAKAEKAASAMQAAAQNAAATVKAPGSDQ